MYSASEWIFLDLWRFINVLLLIIITMYPHVPGSDHNLFLLREWISTETDHYIDRGDGRGKKDKGM